VEDLIAFYQARLDEAEEKAHAALWAGDERWEVLPGQEEPFHRPWQVVDGTYEEGLVWVKPHAADELGVAEHIALQQPLNVLADIAAKRAVLDGFSWEAGETRAITALVQPFASHPDFRPEWAA
jgi:hypothetical protein